MPQNYLSDSAYMNKAYENSVIVDQIDNYVPPRCPGTFKGQSLFYDQHTKQCKPIPPRRFTAAGLAGNVEPQCGAHLPGGNPFHMNVGGQCYSTNTCPTSSDLSEQCLNGQQVVVRENPLVGPGIICGGCYNGCGEYSSNWWKWV